MEALLYIIGAAVLGAVGYAGFTMTKKSRRTRVSAQHNSIAAGRDVSVDSSPVKRPAKTKKK